ncbi:early nodulin-75-like [Chrysoperla carnea]|uniref:early nodulin-75-like n=1 Tax=Chrysoperla carnea TaxID=189513 RepID=UPI001D0890E3|nr:early nodulin-75-like [Chrysoperla carnea]
MKKYFYIVIINIILLSVLTLTYGGFSLICDFECEDLPYRPVCAKNIYGHTVLLKHKCFFKELMCNEPRAYWRFTKKGCFARPQSSHYLPPNPYLPPYPYLPPPPPSYLPPPPPSYLPPPPPSYLPPPSQNKTPEVPCQNLNEI